MGVGKRVKKPGRNGQKRAETGRNGQKGAERSKKRHRNDPISAVRRLGGRRGVFKCQRTRQKGNPPGQGVSRAHPMVVYARLIEMLAKN